MILDLIPKQRMSYKISDVTAVSYLAQLMIMIVIYIFLAAEAEFHIIFSPTRLDLALQEASILV